MNINEPIITSEEELAEDITQCLSTLYSTIAGTQPMDRDFGIDSKFVGMPVEVVMNQYALEIIEKTEEYEPRVSVEEVTFTVDGDTLIPTIHLTRAEEGEEEDE